MIFPKKLLIIFIVFGIFCFVIKNSIYVNAARLLRSPDIISKNEVDKMPQRWGACWCRLNNRQYFLSYDNGEVFLQSKFVGELPKELLSVQDSFVVTEICDAENKKKKIFTYCFGEKKEDEKQLEKSENDKDNLKDPFDGYHIAVPRYFSKNSKRVLPEKISIEKLADLIKKKNVIFYTGAGISAVAGVFTMSELENSFGIEKNLECDEFAKLIVNDPEKLVSNFAKFCQRAFQAPPTKAHKAIAKLALFKKTQILTENFDFLQERAGVVSFRADCSKFKKEVEVDELKQIDAVICIGLSCDDRGFLGWYKITQS